MRITLKRHGEDRDMIEMWSYEGINNARLLMAVVQIDCFASLITEQLYAGVDEMELELK